MKRTIEEIASALEIIKDVCKESKSNGGCHKCPLRNRQENLTIVCGIVDGMEPDIWKIRKPDEWVAFCDNMR